jgi:hypothetical protein
VEEADGDLVLTNNQFAETQYILALSNTFNRDTPFTIGDKVLLDLEKMMVYEEADTNSHERVGRIKLKPIDVDGVMYAIITDGVILGKDER